MGSKKLYGRCISGPALAKERADQQPAKLKVDTSGRPTRTSFSEFDNIPQTSCFGLRRKSSSQSRPKQPSEWLKEAISEGEPKHAAECISPQQPRLQPSKVSSDRACGARSLLRSFNSIAPEMLYDTQILSSKASSLHRNECQSLDPETEDAATQSARIMASYENDEDEAQKKVEACNAPENDRNDGADSIENEEEEGDTFGMPTWTVDPHDIYFISKGDGTNRVCRLGKGDFGPVYLGVWHEQEVSVKLARQKPISLKAERQFQQHVAKLHALDHPNVVGFMGACCWKGGKRSVLVTEYMDKGDLRSLLAREELIAKFAWVRHGGTIAQDIARGMAYLHARGIVHGRLKTTNVLLNRAGVAKVADAALGSLLSHCKASSGTGSSGHSPGRPGAFTAWMAPEVIAGSQPTKAADIYSFGVVLWELLSLETPTSRKLRPVRIPGEAPAKIAYLLERCLATDPKTRPSADHVLAVIAGKH